MAGDISPRLVGILGGMGPLATVELMKRVIENTEAKRDQDHVPMFVANVPQIPDRTEYLRGSGEDPRPVLIKLIRKLEEVGCEAIFMPCNTAHAFYEDLASSASIPIFHMPARTVYEAKRKGISELLLLATMGTYLSGIYSELGRKYGVKVLLPKEEIRKRVHEEIYKGVKAGSLRKDERILKEIREEYGEVTILLGCTELSILKSEFEREFNVIDPLDVSARYLIDFSFRKISEEDLLPPRVIS